MRMVLAILLALPAVASVGAEGNVISFRLLHRDNATLQSEILGEYHTNIPGYEVVSHADASGTNFYWVSRRPILTETDIQSIHIDLNSDSDALVVLTLSAGASRRLGQNPDRHANRRLVLFFREEVLVLPSLTESMAKNAIRVPGALLPVDVAEEMKRVIEKQKPNKGLLSTRLSRASEA